MSSIIPPDIASFWSRRDFLKFMGAATAMAATGCRNRMPDEQILAYAHQPEDLILGDSRFFASSFPMAGFTQGILVETHEGRPTKIEGNPSHPASLGATSYFAQSAVLDLYSPFRLRAPREKNSAVDATWAEVQNFLRDQSLALKTQASPLKIAILTQDVVSPTLRYQLDELVRGTKLIQWHAYSPANRDQIFDGLKEELGQLAEPEYDFANAERILSVDCDFLFAEPLSVAHARAYVQNRKKLRSKLYVAEPSCSITGSKADQRWALASSRLGGFLNEILAGLEKPDGGEYAALTRDLREHRGRSLVLAGFAQDPEIHQLVHRINFALGNIGKTVSYREPLHANCANQNRSFRELASQMRDGQISALIIIGGNPVFDAPADFKFAEALSRVPTKLHLTFQENETSLACDWILPESHFLESWSDAQSPDGTASIVQPTIAPLHSSITAHTLVNWLSGDVSAAAARADYEIVRDHWKTKLGADFETKWRKALTDGVIARADRKEVASRKGTKPVVLASSEQNAIELELRPDPTAWDGSRGENPWLQELPKPTTQLTWDNALLVSPNFANGRALKTSDVVRINVRGQELEVAVFVLQGLPDHSVTLNFGYGSRLTGTVAEGAGFNAYPIRSSAQAWRTTIGSIEKTGKTYELAGTQAHHVFGERDLIKTVHFEDLDHMKPLQKDYRADDSDPSEDMGRGGLGAITAPVPHANLVDHESQWAMSIDLDSCIGCSACVVACQAENNIPTVGKKMVLMGREMHWIRIDRYAPNPSGVMSLNETYVPQPVTCMHCEKAPCEVVCPVGATSHSSDGLNQMIYNRCVGTRYCSNNCPYKVRRFNFFKWDDTTHETLKMARNPEVTVRSRGVMEKCSYCIQRIERVRIKAGREQRPIRDGEIVTACQQSCPTQAIVFGNLKDPKSAVVQARDGARAYGLLTELGTRPRTTYLARISHAKTGAPT